MPKEFTAKILNTGFQAPIDGIYYRHLYPWLEQYFPRYEVRESEYHNDPNYEARYDVAVICWRGVRRVWKIGIQERTFEDAVTEVTNA